jgi:ATP-dependent Clp protease ATP-binding subunit ClpC
MQLASQEAMRLGHDHVGTEHLLLGIVKEGSGSAAIVLGQLNVSLSMVRQKVEELVHGPSPAGPGKPKPTDRHARVIMYAIDEANNLSNNYVGTEHVLLGLLREPEGTAARVLAALNVKHDDVRQAVMTILGKPPQSRNILLDQALKDLKTRLADQMIDPEKVKAVAEAMINAGWRPQQ